VKRYKSEFKESSSDFVDKIQEGSIVSLYIENSGYSLFLKNKIFFSDNSRQYVLETGDLVIKIEKKNILNIKNDYMDDISIIMKDKTIFIITVK